MANSIWLYQIFPAILLVLLADICICDYFYPPSVRSSYYGNYLYRPRRYRSYRGYRGYGSRWHRPNFDRLSSGLIKRTEPFKENFFDNPSYDEGNENYANRFSDEELKAILSNLNEDDDIDKRGFDRLTSGFIRKKRNALSTTANAKSRQRRSVNDKAISEQTNIEQEYTVPEASIGEAQNPSGIDSEISNPVKRKNEEFFSIHRDKKSFDRLRSGFVKKDDGEDIVDKSIEAEDNIIDTKMIKHESENDRDKNIDVDNYEDADADDKRAFDRLRSGFVKKEDDKRRFDRLTSGFVKKADKRYIDRLTSGFVKKEGDKRRFDRLTSGFVKKDDDKRGFDRLTSGFVKKNDYGDDGMWLDKRPFDRLTSGFVKKDDDKRYFDRLTSGLVRRNDEKRRFDRLTSGFVKKDNDKRRFDRLTSGFVKKNDDKRYFDRLNAGFVKKDDKRRFDRLTSGFVKKNDKRYFDRLTSGFVKKDDDKRRFDRLTSGFVKREDESKSNEDINSNTQASGAMHLETGNIGNYQNFQNGDAESRNNKIGGDFTQKESQPAVDKVNNDDLIEEKRRLDRVAYGFIKRNDLPINVVPEVGSAQSEIQKRYFGRLNSGLVKRAADYEDGYQKRRFDRLYSGFVKRPSYGMDFMDRINLGPLKRLDYDTSDLYGDDSDESDFARSYNGDVIGLSGSPLKRRKRSIYTDGRGGFPLTGNRFIQENTFGDGILDNNDGDKINGIERRRFDRLYSGFVKKAIGNFIKDNLYGPYSDIYRTPYSLNSDRL